MRILCTTEATGWTGGANQILLTLRELMRRGHAAAVACRPGAEVDRRMRAAGIETLPVAFRQDYDAAAAWSLARLARAWRPSVVHAHHPKAHAVSLIAALFFGLAPLLVTRHVIYRVGGNPFSRIKYRNRRVAGYVAICEATADRLAGAGVERARIEVIPAGVDMRPWRESRSLRDGTYGSDILMIGHHAPTKGQDIMLRAMPALKREFPGVRLRVAGRGVEALEGLTRELGLGDSVQLLGERSDVPALMSRTRLYAMPSRQEGIGTALIEAQAAGVPAVATRVGGLPEVIEDGVNGLLVPPENPEALAEALASLLRDPARADALAARAVETSERDFSLSVVVDRLEDFYRRLAEGGTRA